MTTAHYLNALRNLFFEDRFRDTFLVDHGVYTPLLVRIKLYYFKLSGSINS